MERVGGNPCHGVGQIDEFQVFAAVESLLLDDMDRIGQRYGLEVQPVGESLLVDHGDAVGNGIFPVMLFKRIENQPFVLFVDQDIVVGHEDRMVGRNGD